MFYLIFVENIFIMKNLTDLCKMLEAGVDPRLSHCSLVLDLVRIETLLLDPNFYWVVFFFFCLHLKVTSFKLSPFLGTPLFVFSAFFIV